MLALNVVTRSFRNLTRPLALEQTAPVLFLWGERATVLLSGVGERSLRAIPFLAGLAFIPLVWSCARHVMLTTEGAALAAATAALCPIDVAYSNFLKPYAVDATVAAGLLLLALRVVAEPHVRGRWIAIGTAAMIAPFVSTPSAFVVGGLIVGLALAPTVHKAAHSRTRFALLTAGVATCAATNFLLLQRVTAESGYMRRYWAGAFFRPPLSQMAAIIRNRAGWGVQELFLGHDAYFPLVMRLALVLAGLVGLFAIGRRVGVWAFTLLAGPVVLAVGASSLHLYPLSERTLLFAAGATVLSVVAGVEVLTAYVPDGATVARSAAFAALSLALLAPAIVNGGLQLIDMTRPDQLRTAVDELTRHVAPNEPIYIFSRDVPVWTYYTTDWRDPDTTRVQSLLSAASSTGPNSGNHPPRGHAVHDEGDSLVVRTGARTELIGVPTGMEAGALGAIQSAPDAGWATNEARRIAGEANPRIWLFFTHCHNLCDTILVDSLTAAGGHMSYRQGGLGARIYEYTR